MIDAPLHGDAPEQRTTPRRRDARPRVTWLTPTASPGHATSAVHVCHEIMEYGSGRLAPRVAVSGASFLAAYLTTRERGPNTVAKKRNAADPAWRSIAGDCSCRYNSPGNSHARAIADRRPVEDLGTRRAQAVGRGTMRRC